MNSFDRSKYSKPLHSAYPGICSQEIEVFAHKRCISRKSDAQYLPAKLLLCDHNRARLHGLPWWPIDWGGGVERNMRTDCQVDQLEGE